jgi:hypothetical protein
MVELLIEQFDETVAAEGIFYMPRNRALELLELLKQYGSKPDQRQKEIDSLNDPQ